MASKVNDEASRQTRELALLQDSYRKRKADIRSQGERELGAIKERYSSKIKKVNSDTQASINHIKNSKNDEVQRIRLAAIDFTRKEKNALEQKKSRLNEAHTMQVTNLKSTLEQRRSALKKGLQALKVQEKRDRDKEALITKGFVKQEQNQRRSVQKSNHQTLEKINQSNQRKKSESISNYRKEKEALKYKHDNHLSQLTSRQQIKQKRLSEQGFQKLKEQRDVQQLKFEKAQSKHRNKIGELKSKVLNQLKNEKSSSNRQLRNIQQKNTLARNHERNRGIVVVDALKKEYDGEYLRLQHRGESHIQNEKDKQDNVIKDQKLQHDQELKEHVLVHRSKIEKVGESFQTSFKLHGKQYEKQLDQQRHEFKQKQGRVNDFFQESLSNQRSSLLKQLVSEKKEILETVGKYADKKADPFYRLKNVALSVKETPHFYNITADIPPHEKDNIQLLVQADKIILTGKRRFQDDISDAGHRVETSKYQSFREEIPIIKKIDMDGVHRSYKDGLLSVRVPKV